MTAAGQQPFTRLAPAKLNLDLRVGPPRADGFHPIRSWFVTVGLYDRLDFSPADDIRLTCDDASLPTDGRNLVVRAAEALRPAGGPGVAIRLEKSIPAGGGLGGGSSDAAITLQALNGFWRLGLSIERLHEIAATLGSDVPFFLHGPSSLCEGRGDVVTPIPPPSATWAVLILPGIAMPTPAVFRRFDELRPDADELGPFVRPKAELSTGLLPKLVNDLEIAAFDLRPDLAAHHDAAERRLQRPVRMSGSGSTLFTLYGNGGAAKSAAGVVTETLGIHAVAVRMPAGSP